MSLIKAQKVIVGKTIKGDKARDAVHIGVIPAFSEDFLLAGDRVYIKEVVGDSIKVGNKGSKYVGIVDPFLTEELEANQKFWVFLAPNLSRELRHDWKCNLIDKKE